MKQFNFKFLVEKEVCLLQASGVCAQNFLNQHDENGKKHVPIKVHFIGVGILEIPDTQTIIDAKEEILKNPPKVA